MEHGVCGRLTCLPHPPPRPHCQDDLSEATVACALLDSLGESRVIAVSLLLLLVAEFGGAARIAVGIPAVAFLVGLGPLGLRMLRDPYSAANDVPDAREPVPAGSH